MSNPIDFSGKVAFVTGGSRGIGRGIAAGLAELGASVAIVSRDEGDASRVAGEVSAGGSKTRGYGCDVSSFDDTQAVAKAVIEEFGRVDFVVNNAGVTGDKLLLRMTPDDWKRVLDINLTGAYNVVKAFAPALIKQRSGRIVNMTSIVGLTGNAGQASYAASKAGIIGLTKSLAKELASRGITVNAVAPGYITTDMTADLGDAAREAMLQATPLGRLGSVEDVAGVVIFLLSGLADYVTGQVINCDGGMVMG